MNIYRTRLTEHAVAGLAGVAFACLLAAPALAVPSVAADAPEHNARVAEYLMQTYAGPDEHNAGVAEYDSMTHSR